jgi:hypothetical protein
VVDSEHVNLGLAQTNGSGALAGAGRTQDHHASRVQAGIDSEEIGQSALHQPIVRHHSGLRQWREPASPSRMTKGISRWTPDREGAPPPSDRDRGRMVQPSLSRRSSPLRSQLISQQICSPVQRRTGWREYRRSPPPQPHSKGCSRNERGRDSLDQRARRGRVRRANDIRDNRGHPNDDDQHTQHGPELPPADQHSSQSDTPRRRSSPTFTNSIVSKRGKPTTATGRAIAPTAPRGDRGRRLALLLSDLGSVHPDRDRAPPGTPSASRLRVERAIGLTREDPSGRTTLTNAPEPPRRLCPPTFQSDRAVGEPGLRLLVGAVKPCVVRHRPTSQVISTKRRDVHHPAIGGSRRSAVETSYSSIVILPRERDPRLITIRRGGTLTDTDHPLHALWAAACAEHVLHFFESVCPTDTRPRKAIKAFRAWTEGRMKMMESRAAGGHAMGAARELTGPARHAAYAAGQAACVAHVAEHNLGAAAYAIKAARAGNPGHEEVAGRLECEWQRAQLPGEIRELVIEDQRRRNAICWQVFDFQQGDARGDP